MLAWILRPLRQLAQAAVAHDSSRQIAWGFSLGMVIGLMPKANLLVASLGVLLCAVRVNRPASLVAIAIFSWVGPLTDGFAHRVGELALGWEAAQSTLVRLYEMPLGPYLGFHNTAVTGQLLLGLYFFYPVYFCVKWATDRIQPPLRKWLMGYRVIRWLRGAEFGARLGIES